MEYISVIQFAEKFGISERTAPDTCLTAQNNYVAMLDYFKIRH